MHVSLAELVQDLVVKFHPKVEEEEVELEADASPDLAVVQGDIGLIEHLLSIESREGKGTTVAFKLPKSERSPDKRTE